MKTYLNGDPRWDGIKILWHKAEVDIQIGKRIENWWRRYWTHTQRWTRLRKTRPVYTRLHATVQGLFETICFNHLGYPLNDIVKIQLSPLRKDPCQAGVKWVKTGVLFLQNQLNSNLTAFAEVRKKRWPIWNKL